MINMIKKSIGDMPMKRKIICKIVVLMLVGLMFFSLSVLAATTLFVKKSNGFNCVGSGFISGRSFLLSFSATPLPSVPVQPDEVYASTIEAFAYSPQGNLIGYSLQYGGRVHQLSSSVNDLVKLVSCHFSFGGYDLGWYTLK